MKRTANIETILDILTYGTRNQKSKTFVMNGLGLPVAIGKPLLDELDKKGLMKKRRDNKFITTKKGSQYLSDITNLNKTYEIDSVIEALSEAKRKYYETKKSRTT